MVLRDERLVILQSKGFLCCNKAVTLIYLGSFPQTDWRKSDRNSVAKKKKKLVKEMFGITRNSVLARISGYLDSHCLTKERFLDLAHKKTNKPEDLDTLLKHF